MSRILQSQSAISAPPPSIHSQSGVHLGIKQNLATSYAALNELSAKLPPEQLHISRIFPDIPHPLYTHQRYKSRQAIPYIKLHICGNLIIFITKKNLTSAHNTHISGLTAAEFLIDQQLGSVM